MKRVAFVVLIVGSAATASAQTGWTAVAPVPVPEQTPQMAAERLQTELRSLNIVRPVETRITKGAPYSGDAVTEFTQVLSDGNRIQRKTVTRTFRDSEGRTRREQTTTSASGEKVSVTISDPVAGMSWVLDSQNRTALQNRSFFAAGVGRGGGRGVDAGGGEAVAARGGGGGGRGGAVAPATVPPTLPEGHDIEQRRQIELGARAAAGPGPVKEELGQQMIEGVMAEGSRTTTTIAAGTIGNAQAIKIVSEQWFSPDLQVLIMTRHSDPRSGETVYKLTNIIRGEQDRSLFEVPADYTIQEGRRQP